MIAYTYEDDEFTCPYCGNKEMDSWEYPDEDSEVITCSECGKKYHGEQVRNVNYKGTPDCELNNEEHKFEDLPSYPNFKRCSICEKISSTEDTLKQSGERTNGTSN